MHLLREPFRWPWGSGGTVPSASPSTAGLGYQMWVCTSRSWISPQQTQMLVAVLIKKNLEKREESSTGFASKNECTKTPNFFSYQEVLPRLPPWTILSNFVDPLLIRNQPLGIECLTFLRNAIGSGFTVTRGQHLYM